MDVAAERLALRERGIIVRVSAATLVVVNSILLLIALDQPDSFALSTSATLALALPHLAVEGALAAMPWQRWLPERPRPWLLRGHVAYNVVGLFAALAIAQGGSTSALWLLAFNLVYSALILPTREHLVVACTTVLGAPAVLLATRSLSLEVAVDLIALTGVAVLATIGSGVVWAALLRAERARIEADDSAAALHDALVAMHTTSSGDIGRILRATVRAAVRSPHDMAAVYVLDGSEVRTVFERVPHDMRRDDPDHVRGIIAGVDEHGSGVLDHDQARGGHRRHHGRPHAGSPVQSWRAGRVGAAGRPHRARDRAVPGHGRRP